MEQETTPRDGVFISYSHEGEEHAARVLALSNRLIKDGIDCIIDQYDPHPAEDWPQWMSRQLREAEFVLIIFTETYLNRWDGTETPGIGKGVKWEVQEVRNYIYDDDSLIKRFIPVVFRAEDTAYIPVRFKGHTHYCFDSEENYETLYRRLTGQEKITKPPVGKKKKLSSEPASVLQFNEGVKESEPVTQPVPVKPDVSLSRLPVSGEYLLGREWELSLLHDAWGRSSVNLFTVVAFGGVGKSALVNRWLDGLAPRGYGGAARVWGWSFYSQGSGDGRQASADTFMNIALREFGDPDPTAGYPWERGVRLARLVRCQKTLLVLDGLEPLQEPAGPGKRGGRVKDQGVATLLRELSFDNPGLCVVTTRVPLEDLSGKVFRPGPGDTPPPGDKFVCLLCLDHLRPETGAQLLRKHGVEGPDKELLAASKTYGGHALALNLLGTYLSEVHNGDIRCAGGVPLLSEEVDDTGHAGRVIAGYEFYLKGEPELELLYLLGFFDRPAEAAALQALTTPDPLPGTTTTFETLTTAKWKRALNRLYSLGLLSEVQEDKPTAQEFFSPTLLSSYLPAFSLDAHPLVREYFSRRLKAMRPKAYTTGHRRLYQYYKGVPEQEQPDSLLGLEPLYKAISHGCEAGLHSEVFKDIYRSRINRGDEYYSLHKLDAFSSDLAALSSFFREPWKRPVEGLSEQDKAEIFNLSGYSLRALGRLRESAQPMEAALEANKEDENWKGAAINASNLSELCLCLGDVGRATALGRESVALADRSGDEGQMFTKRTTHADALHQAGDWERAEGLFRDAEARQKKRQPGYDYLYSVRGFKYNDLLLGRGRSGEVRKRAEKTLEWDTPFGRLLDIGLHNLSLGRAHWQESSSPGSGSAQTARQYLDRAVEGLREAGQQDDLPRGLLARGGFLRWAGEPETARHDLEEAREIAERGEMKLFLTDYHLETCKLELSLKDKNKAKIHLDKAKLLVKETGYHRRDGDVRELEGKEGRKVGG